MSNLAKIAGRILTLLGVVLLTVAATACSRGSSQPSLVPAGASRGQNTFLFLYADD